MPAAPPAVRATDGALPGVVILDRPRFDDERGWFAELWRAESYRALGVPEVFVQDNVSVSRRGVVRGLHLQAPRTQAKLVSVLHGEILDVVVDVRAGSPTHGQWEGIVLSATNGRQVFVPDGYAHGFAVLSDEAIVTYKCSTPYDAASELVVRWDDPAIGIDWRVDTPIVSPKDRAGRLLADFAPGELPSASTPAE